MLLGNKILVVDDTPAALRATVRILQSAGFDVAQAVDGTEALRQIRALRPRLVLLDVVLPDISGLEVLRQIRADAELSEIGVVLLSARQIQPDQQAAGLDAGAVGYIIRPVTNQEFLARVRSQIRQLELLEQLRASEARFQDLITRQHDGVLVVDHAGLIQFVNPAAEALAGRPAGELLGSRFAFPLGDSVDQVITWPRPDLQLKRAQMRVGSLEWNGQPARLVTLRDVTREIQLEAQCRQSQKMEAVGTLAGGVAHDFNNILAVIQVQAEMLKYSGRLSVPQKELARDIEAAVRRAATLIRQLLLFSRNESFQARDLDLGESLTNTIKMLRCLLGEAIEIRLDQAEPSLFVHADAGMLDQVVVNLAVNARDAMPNGGRLVIATAAVEFDEFAVAQSGHARLGSFVCLSVSDTGCGIPPEILPRIFDPFFTTKEVGQGTGLGLATVFGIVQQHQGWITVDSEVGHGTTFKIFLPRVSDPVEIKPSPPAPPDTPVGKETILLVEDDSNLRTALQKSLTQLGYCILPAATGAAALAACREHHARIHLVITDLVMPGGLTGKALAQRLRSETPGLKVLFLSGYSARLEGEDFPLVEGVNFLAKPFPLPTLAQTIRAILDGQVDAVADAGCQTPTA